MKVKKRRNYKTFLYTFSTNYMRALINQKFRGNRCVRLFFNSICNWNKIYSMLSRSTPPSLLLRKAVAVSIYSSVPYGTQ